jgi:hypothetical protein
MKLIRVLAVFVLVVVLASSAFGFNGLRKGFVLGGGLGIAPMIRISLGDADNSEVGPAANIFLGYAWDEYNMIVYESNVTVYEENQISAAQGFGGASWYHYFGEQGKSFFTVVGLGFQYYEVEDFDANDAGAAYLIGGGYEFTRHVQVVLYLSGGKSSQDFIFTDIDYGHNHMSISVNAVAF